MSPFRTIPGEGPTPCRIMVIGSHPGRDEERLGRPFVGVTGRELEQYLRHIGLYRDHVYLTNLVKERPLSDKEIPDSMIERWAPELVREIQRVGPEYVLACSAVVVDWITVGTEYEGMGLEMLHGLTLWHPGLECWIVPAYHPASGLHDSGAMLNVLRDVEAFGRALEGEYNIPVDMFPEPDYRHVSSAPEVGWLNRAKIVGLDTEGVEHSPWSVQVSAAPGKANLALHGSEAVNEIDVIIHRIKSPVYVHNSLHDLAVCRSLGITLPDYPRTVDTMVMAYHLCDEPQGLKALAWRHCGMRMQAYEEVVAPEQAEMSLRYLEAAHSIDWGPAEKVKVWKGGVEKSSQPWSINRRLEKMIADYRGVKPTELRAWFGEKGYPFGEMQESKVDLWKRWIDAGKRKNPLTGAMEEGDEQDAEAAIGFKEQVEREMGPMPQATLEDVEFDRALRYACRDADAQVRVALSVREKYKEIFG